MEAMDEPTVTEGKLYIRNITQYIVYVFKVTTGLSEFSFTGEDQGCSALKQLKKKFSTDDF